MVKASTSERTPEQARAGAARQLPATTMMEKVAGGGDEGCQRELSCDPCLFFLFLVCWAVMLSWRRPGAGVHASAAADVAALASEAAPPAGHLGRHPGEDWSPLLFRLPVSPSRPLASRAGLACLSSVPSVALCFVS